MNGPLCLKKNKLICKGIIFFDDTFFSNMTNILQIYEVFLWNELDIIVIGTNFFKK